MPNYQGPLTRSRKRKRDSESSTTLSQNKNPKQDSIWPLVQEQNLNKKEEDYLKYIENSIIRTIENPQLEIQDALDYISLDRNVTQVEQNYQPRNDLPELDILNLDPSLRNSLYQQKDLKEITQEELDEVLNATQT